VPATRFLILLSSAKWWKIWVKNNGRDYAKYSTSIQQKRP